MADYEEGSQASRSVWLWGIVGFVVLILVVVWAWPEAEPDYAVEPVEEVVPATAPEPVERPLDLAGVLANPDDYAGTTFPDRDIRVADVPTDRGFWIEEDGHRLFALIIDRPAERPVDINPEAVLRIQGGTFRTPAHLTELEGDPLEPDTRRIAEDQEIFLVVDERHIEVREEGEPQPGTTPAGEADDG